MFVPSVEQWLMIGMVGFYLYDSTTLLYCNEGFLLPSGQGGWKVALGSTRFHVFGKEVFIPNPFTFHRPLFRMSWRLEGASDEKFWTPPNYSFIWLTVWLWVVAFALFVLFPLGIFRIYPDNILILGLFFLYLSILMALCGLWKDRKIFTLCNRRFFLLAFESLICPPFALNLIRHASAGMVIDADLLISARHLQKPAAWQKSRAEFMLRIEEEISHEEEESDRGVALRVFLDALKKEEAHGYQ